MASGYQPAAPEFNRAIPSVNMVPGRIEQFEIELEIDTEVFHAYMEHHGLMPRSIYVQVNLDDFQAVMESGQSLRIRLFCVDIIEMATLWWMTDTGRLERVWSRLGFSREQAAHRATLYADFNRRHNEQGEADRAHADLAQANQAQADQAPADQAADEPGDLEWRP